MKLPKSSIKRVTSDYSKLQLGDPRRRRRAEQILSKLARSPSASLPHAMGNQASLTAAYRFANNASIAFADLMAASIGAAAARATAARRVLVLHDTTDCSFPDLDPAEIGYLQTGKAGFKLHLSLILDAGAWRRPLGFAHVETIHRERRSRRGGRKKRLGGSATSKWKDREFLRWSRGMTASAEALRECERVLHIADRESDSFDLMALMIALGQGFIFRVRVDRRGRIAGTEDDSWSTVKDIAATCEGLLERAVPLSRRRGGSAPGMKAPRKMRMARLTFAATTIEIPRPRSASKDLPPVLRVNLVHVIEKDPPPGQDPVEWLLYTSEPIDTAAHVEEIVDHYRARWTIEEINSAIKTGTAYEAREFETRHALLNMLALSLPIACEMLWLRSRARSSPNTPATEVLTPLQLRILRKLGPRKLSAKPTAQEALLAVAALGGHQRNNGDPGWKILHRAMSLLHAYEQGWLAASTSRRRRGDL